MIRFCSRHWLGFLRAGFSLGTLSSALIFALLLTNTKLDALSVLTLGIYAYLSCIPFALTLFGLGANIAKMSKSVSDKYKYELEKTRNTDRYYEIWARQRSEQSKSTRELLERSNLVLIAAISVVDLSAFFYGIFLVSGGFMNLLTPIPVPFNALLGLSFLSAVAGFIYLSAWIENRK